MSQSYERELFELIFSDAHVIDLDFSSWDKEISLYVIADHVDSPVPSRLPLFAVRFVRPRQFQVSFAHFAIKLADPSHHFQWKIDDFTVSTCADGISVNLFGASTWPRVQIICEDITICRCPHALLDELFPNWDIPFSALARPGIEGLAEIFRHKKGDDGTEQ